MLLPLMSTGEQIDSVDSIFILDLCLHHARFPDPLSILTYRNHGTELLLLPAIYVLGGHHGPLNRVSVKRRDAVAVLSGGSSHRLPCLPGSGAGSGPGERTLSRLSATRSGWATPCGITYRPLLDQHETASAPPGRSLTGHLSETLV